ncbi:amino acid--tRNA ligase-related protein, partial [uncultured Clostridium sp.]|uniref:amino acid--tRNA ligase-related protein n=1 Tax=uncultured Clostridium sp. TaxID=59620 RepID=UPI0028E7700B
RMTFKDAMEKYGSDKPDLRFGMEITNITEDVKDMDFVVFKSAIEAGGSVRALCLKGGATLGRKPLDKLGEFVKTYKAKGLAWIQLKEDGVKSSIAKFLTDDVTNSIIETMGAETGDAILIVADKESVVFQSLGALRLELAKQFELIKDKNEFNFTWITEFPLFEYSEEEERYTACHHPFTAPMEEDLEFLESDPGKVRSKAYDLVLNGEELGGGSIRIHDMELQQRMFKALGFTEEQAWERFGFLLQAFKFGPPPHGGLAFGLDRMIMFLAGTENIKNVIAFPKNQNAYCYLSEAPNIADEKQLTELGIEILPKQEKQEQE